MICASVSPAEARGVGQVREAGTRGWELLGELGKLLTPVQERLPLGKGQGWGRGGGRGSRGHSAQCERSVLNLWARFPAFAL